MPKDVFGNLPEDWKAKVPYTLDSCVRYNYQVPNQQPILKGNNTRYGCNRTKKIPALGVGKYCILLLFGVLKISLYSPAEEYLCYFKFALPSIQTI